MKPFAWRIEFFPDVFHHALFFVHAHLAVVLPAPFIVHVAFGVFAGNEVVIPTPPAAVHRVDVATCRIGPLRGTLFGERIGGEALIGGGFVRCVVIGVTRHPLLGAVDEQLVDVQARGRLGLKNAALAEIPVQVQLESAAHHRLASVAGPVDDRVLFRARVLGGQGQRLGQVVNPVGQGHRCRLLTKLARSPQHITGFGQGGDRRVLGPRVGVQSVRVHMHLKGAGGQHRGGQMTNKHRLHGHGVLLACVKGCLNCGTTPPRRGR